MAREHRDHSPTPPPGSLSQVDAPPGLSLQPHTSSRLHTSPRYHTQRSPHLRLPTVPILKHPLETFRQNVIYGESNFALLSGNAAMPVALEVGRLLKLPDDHIPQNPDSFANHEMNIYVPPHHVATRDVYTIQTTDGNHEANLTRLKLLMEGAKGNGANRNTAIVLHMPYSRQDRRAKPGQAEAARLNELEVFRAGSHNPDKKWPWQHETKVTAKTNLIVVDVHSTKPLETINAASNYEWANLDAGVVLRPKVREMIAQKNLDVAIAFPDKTAAVRYAGYADEFVGGVQNAAIIKKERDVNRQNEVTISAEQESLAPKVAGKDVFIIDDIADTMRTVLQTAKKLKEDGARSVHVVATHGVLSVSPEHDIDAFAAMDDEAIDSVMITDTIQQNRIHPKLTVVSIAPLIAETIRRIENREPLGELVMPGNMSPGFEKSYRKFKVNKERRRVQRIVRKTRRGIN